MKLYKLVSHDGRTWGTIGNYLQWGENITHRVNSNKPRLCSNTVIHAYKHPIVAILADWRNGNYLHEHGGKLWVAEGNVVVDGNIKVGCNRLTTIEQIPFPKISIARIQEIVIRYAARPKDKIFDEWRKHWRYDPVVTWCMYQVLAHRIWSPDLEAKRLAMLAVMRGKVTNDDVGMDKLSFFTAQMSFSNAMVVNDEDPVKIIDDVQNPPFEVKDRFIATQWWDIANRYNLSDRKTMII